MSVDRKLRVFPAADQQAGAALTAGQPGFYEPLAIFDDNGGVVKIAETSDKKYKAEISILDRFPEKYSWEETLVDYHKKSFTFSADFDPLKTACTDAKLQKDVNPRPIPVTMITFAIPGYETKMKTNSGSLNWNFEYVFDTKEEAEKFKKLIESGELTSEIRFDYPYEQKIIYDETQTVISFVSDNNVYGDFSQNAATEFVFRKQLNDIVNKLVVTANITIGRDTNLKPIELSPAEIMAFADRFYSREEWLRSEQIDTEIETNLNEYLLPRLKNIFEKHSDEVITVKEQQKKQAFARSTGDGARIGAIVPIYGAVITGDVTTETKRERAQQIIDAIRKEEGISYAYNEQTNTLEPTSIDIFKRQYDSKFFEQVFRREVADVVSKAMITKFPINAKTQVVSKFQKVFEERKAVEWKKYQTMKTKIEADNKEYAKWIQQYAEAEKAIVRKFGDIRSVEKKWTVETSRNIGGSNEHHYGFDFQISNIASKVEGDELSGTLIVTMTYEGDTKKDHKEITRAFGRVTSTTTHPHPGHDKGTITVTYTRKEGKTKFSSTVYAPRDGSAQEKKFQEIFNQKIPKP